LANQQHINSGIPDPINALQNLASQGTRPSNQQVGMVPQASNSNLQQQQQQQQQPQMGGIPNAMNIRPQNPMSQANIVMQQQQQQVSSQNPINPMQMGNAMGNVNVGMKPNLQQLNPQQQMNPNQMIGNPGMMSQGQMSMQNNPQQMNAMNQNQMMMMMNNVGNPGMVRPSNMPPNQMVNPMGMNQNPVVPNQNTLNIQPMRKQQEVMMQNAAPNAFSQVRSVTPNFLRQSPSPSVPSPIGLSSSQHGIGIASPAMVPSPQSNPLSNQSRVNMAMAPSPSAPMNTPGGQIQAVQSPMNPADDQIYREKYNRLTKYKEPLKKMIMRVGSDGINSEKITKLKKLLEILSNPDTRIPLETLVKCEIVLENQFGALKDTPSSSINNPLYDAILNCLQNPLGKHILNRTFTPSLSQWFGPDIKNLPPSKKRRLSDDHALEVSTQHAIPHILQREIAHLDLKKYKLNLDQTAQAAGSKIIAITCCLDDKQLPLVPPISILIPEDYPSSSPQCYLTDYEYDDTQFLINVKKSFKLRASKLPPVHSLTHVLETWANAIRQACNPNFVECSTESVLLGF
jgi:mediator of RNA polymerase II transcription subunit 15